MRHDKCSVKTELLMQNSYNLPMRGIFWCSYLGEEIYSLALCLLDKKQVCQGPGYVPNRGVNDFRDKFYSYLEIC